MLALALIALAAIAAYHNSFAGAFIFDDSIWIVENPSIQRLWPIWRVLCPPNAGKIGGRPVVSLTLAVNYALGGTNVWGYHAVNLAIHILAAWALFGVTRRTLISPRLQERFGSAATPLALIVATLWTVHPLQTEAVTYVIQRTEALVGLFYLLTLYCVIRGATSGKAALWYVAATAACLVGMATKEVMATAPVIVLLYDRTFLTDSFREALRRRYGLYLALAATWSVVAGLLISTGFHGGTTGFELQKFTWWSYLLTQPGVIVHYLRLTFWPAGLCFDYGWPAPQTVGEVVVPGVLVTGLLGLTVWALMKRPAWGFLGAWFFVILAPTSSFVPIQDVAFEHRMYLSLAAVVTSLVAGGWFAGEWLVCRGLISLPAMQAVGGSLAVFAGVALAILTVSRNADYRSDLSIWQDTIDKAPDNERAHLNLGNALIDCGRSDEALAHYRRALELKPDYAEIYYNLGAALASRGQRDEAIAHYQKALEFKPDYVQASYNLGVALTGCGRLDEAVTQFSKALAIKPDFAEARNNLAIALRGCGRLDDAIAQYYWTLAIKPNYAEARNNLGVALTECGRLDEAITQFSSALAIKPDYVDAHNNLGVAQSRREGILKDLAKLRELLRSRPDDLTLLNDTAWVLATNPNASVRSGAEAIELAQRAVQLSAEREPAVLGTLAAAYAEAGKFSEAVQTAKMAMDLAASQNNAALADVLRTRTKHYQAGSPYRDTQPPSIPKSSRP